MNGRWFTIGLLLLAKAPLVYVVAYLANVQSEFVSVSRGPLNRSAVYRLGGKAAKELFAPVNGIDRIARPWYWVTPDPTDPARIKKP